ncbi:AMP-dependent synthetase/ligase [Penicillium occitanis (nom. inval.)]|nr:AMP-dependent synthetase/ligase [Penicillium occitanis (nom. inval.)]PCG90777.1 hypothetical protein PENOC_100410 [Penicillium occitanis (nom. inval.)]
MVFLPPPWLPDINAQIPPGANVGDFVLAGRRATGTAQPALICAKTGKGYTGDDVGDKVEILARALCRDLGWSPNKGSSKEKVIAILSENSIDFLVVCWAIHRIGGTCLLLQPTTSAVEIVSHMTKARCQILFSSEELLPICEEFFNLLPVPPRKLYSMDKSGLSITNYKADIKSLQELLKDRIDLQEIEQLHGRDASCEVAYLITTSGTSGLQKLAQITHANMIANVIQPVVFESVGTGDWPRIGLGILPLNHSYGLVTTHAMFYRGDTTVTHGSFDIQLMLESIQKHRIERLYLVPSVISTLIANPILFELYDVSSVKDIVLGAAACGESLSQKIHELQPQWRVLVGYGLTECGSIVAWSRSASIIPGSSGSLLPSYQARLIDDCGADITEHDVPGEIYLKSPSRIPGYLGEDDAANAKFLVDGWLPTGDIGFFRLGPMGDEHLFVVDRLKDMIKVNGLQVNPGEIEEVLRKHPSVADAAIVGIKDVTAGERPLAFVITTSHITTSQDRGELILELDESVKSQLHESYWLRKQICPSFRIALITKNLDTTLEKQGQHF